MVFRGTVLNESGQPLIGAHVTTLFRRKNVGTITDFDGVFEIGDARSDESWKIGHIGYGDIIFRIPRSGGKRTFRMVEKAFELEEVVLTPRKNGANDFQDNFQQLVENFPDKKKKGFWETLKENPLMAAGIGVVAFLGISAVVSMVARESDKLEQKRLAKG